MSRRQEGVSRREEVFHSQIQSESVSERSILPFETEMEEVREEDSQQIINYFRKKCVKYEK